ncbi:hypothetical protein NQ315_015482 [Exocentrus adspersus]|uniref:Uncharacterized protein n=1 Tax=Exocentrus adspersus TaxID=1586481 RepID=A0AAV8VNA7_9CUCU|nr:hypothetical protein NQ315_015482 [Exocentrus adspersus]
MMEQIQQNDLDRTLSHDYRDMRFDGFTLNTNRDITNSVQSTGRLLSSFPIPKFNCFEVNDLVVAAKRFDLEENGLHFPILTFEDLSDGIQIRKNPKLIFGQVRFFRKNSITDFHNNHIWTDENPQRIAETHFQEQFSKITLRGCSRVRASMRRRVDECITVGGGHFQQLL